MRIVKYLYETVPSPYSRSGTSRMELEVEVNGERLRIQREFYDQPMDVQYHKRHLVREILRTLEDRLLEQL